MNRLLLLLIVVLIASVQGSGQCPPGQASLKVVLLTDNYPQETSWKIYDPNQNVVAQSATGLSAGQLYVDSICVPVGSCYHFKITDAVGDGICCGYGNGYFEVYYNNVLVKKDSSFGHQSNAYVGCAQGGNCDYAQAVGVGTYLAPHANYWYSFTPAATALYTVTTCGIGNTCNTKLWMYDYCANLVYDSTNAATIYYATNNCGGIHAQINAYLLSGHTYYIRVGDEGSSCAGSPIQWFITQNTATSGCMDTLACNYNPFATVSNPSACIYYPSPLCPSGPDLITDSLQLSQSIFADTLTVDYQDANQSCLVQEGCLNGYGIRELVKFDTRIENIGATDFYAGTPPANSNTYSAIYEWDACHGHWHFENYAEYLLADSQNHFVPVGYKNGFCVLDLACTTGTPKFGCNNMGITAGCADVYGAYLACQWVDVTDIPDGNYKLIVRANWTPRPDFYGRYETSYTNNWARACVTLSHDTGGKRQVVVLPACAPYVDCAGVTNGLTTPDCAGQCGGTRLTGDLNLDSLRNQSDVQAYLLAAINHSLTPAGCTDLNDDQQINVVDAALLFECAKHGGGAIPNGHAHEPCRFPNKIKNLQQKAAFSIGNIDYVASTVDIFIKNENCKPLAYQLKLKGLTLQHVQHAMTGFTPTMYYKPSGEIIALSSDEIAMPKNLAPTLLCRVQFATIDTTLICIDSVVAVVNSAYEQVSHTIDSNACIAAIPTPTTVATVARSPFALFPNPASDAAAFALNDAQPQLLAVTLYDVMGRVIRKYPAARRNTLVIAREDLPAGLYFVEATLDSRKWREKLIFQ